MHPAPCMSGKDAYICLRVLLCATLQRLVYSQRVPMTVGNQVNNSDLFQYIYRAYFIILYYDFYLFIYLKYKIKINSDSVFTSNFLGKYSYLGTHAKCVPGYCDPVPTTRVKACTWRPAVPNDTDPHTHYSFTCFVKYKPGVGT